MARIIAVLIAAVFFAIGAQAQPVPTKTITFYNNSAKQILYPVIQAPIINGAGVHDLWMQAILDVKDLKAQIFNTTLLYKIYVNRGAGIPPHGSLTVTVPFYTQLLPTTPGNLGKVNDQFVDWWNAMRVFIFNGPDAVNAAYDYSVDRAGVVIPPIPVNPVAGAAVPSCTSGTTTCEPLLIKAYVNGFPTSVPAQLVEYTFAAAQGPPLNPVLSINTATVNYNISAVDQVYLPAAIGAHGNATAKNTYLGSTESVATFRKGLAAFTDDGMSWPFYVPAYYTATHPTIPLASPPPGVDAYPLPQIPSTNTVYAESFRKPPPAPPVLSSDTPNGIGELGTVAQGTLDLWERCKVSVKRHRLELRSDIRNSDETCDNIQAVDAFFVADFHTCFPGAPLPNTQSFLRDVYGWVQFPGCSTPLASVPGYDATIVKYCDLQYNFFDASVPTNNIFNPYVALIHRTLASNAYAFSIDDAVSFKSVPGDGVVVTVAGTNGLENKTQTPLPTATTYKTYCRAS